MKIARCHLKQVLWQGVKLFAIIGIATTVHGQAQTPPPNKVTTATNYTGNASSLVEFEMARKTFKDFQVESVDEFIKIKEFHHQFLSDGNLTHQFKLKDGHLVHCIEIGSQSAVKRLGANPKTVGFAPTVSPPILAGQNRQIGINPADFGMDGSLDADGNARKCPIGSIPVLIPSLEDLCRFRKLEDRFRKYPISANAHSSAKASPLGQQSSPPANSSFPTHEHAYGTASIANLGGQAEFSSWQPGVQPNNEASIEQIWVSGGSGAGLQTVEAGWQVSYALNGDWLSHFFIFFTTNGYDIANDSPYPYGGGYNLYGQYFLNSSGNTSLPQYSGVFVQTSSSMIVGVGLNPSTPGGSQLSFTLAYYLEPTTQNWWLFINNTAIGYYPISLFNAQGLAGNASAIQFGGEIVNNNTGGVHTTTQMGSGQFAEAGFLHAAYIRNMEYFDLTHTAQYANNLTAITEAPKYYDIQYLPATSPVNPVLGASMYFGGPGEVDNSVTLAGKVLNPGSADGTGTVSAQFNNPIGVAVDAVGNVYVADTGNNTIRKVTPGGTVTTLAGLAGHPGYTNAFGTNAAFYNPIGIAVNTAGVVYVVDNGNGAIRCISPAGAVTTLVDGVFNSPSGVAVDASGNVYVGDTYNQVIRKVTPGGSVATLAGVVGVAGTNDGTGSGALFNDPEGVAVDSFGNVYVADLGSGTIRKVTAGGVVTTLASSPGNLGDADGAGGYAQFEQPYGVAVDGYGNVYVADFLNQEIRKVTPGGVVSTMAGQHYVKGSTDGTWTNALFFFPQGVAVDGSGNVYVADSSNDTIRKLLIPA